MPFRPSTTTRRQLAWLKPRFGSLQTVQAIAIYRLYIAEGGEMGIIERQYRYVGHPVLTRGNYGVNVTGAHTRSDDPDHLYVLDPDCGDQLWCTVASATACGFVPEHDAEE